MPARIELDPSAMARLERTQANYLKIQQRGGIWNSVRASLRKCYASQNEHGDVTGKMLVGRMPPFDTPFKDDGKDMWWIYEAGCFGDLSKQIVDFQFSHNPATKAADTTNHLTILSDGRFVLDLEAIDRGPFIASLVESGVAASMSFGVDEIEHSWETVGDQNVAVVTKARLREISQVTEGMAGEHVWCAVVDKDTFPELIDGVECEQFNTLHKLHQLSHRAKAIKQQVERLNAKPPKKTFTTNELNHLQTQETERLQALAYGRLKGW